MSVPKIRISPAEYLAFERKSEIKHEFYNGEIFAMGGASREHNLVCMNVSSEIRQQLKGKSCEAYPNDMRVFIPATGLYTYPDIVVVCGTPQFQDEEFDTLLNPVLIIEVLSPSTESYDRGKKFANYRSIESLQEYLLIAQDEYHIDRYLRHGEFWLLSEARTLEESLELTSIECVLDMREVYDKITFTTPEAETH